jgi:hypothetical protein
MKIRIKGNSVRYRLTRSEVETFSKNGFLSETTHFLSNTLTYALKAAPGQDELSADLNNNNITLYFPDTEKEIWYRSERVGYKHVQVLPDGTRLTLLIEKDFACLDHVDEDQSDNYPNPNKTC